VLDFGAGLTGAKLLENLAEFFDRDGARLVGIKFTEDGLGCFCSFLLGEAIAEGLLLRLFRSQGQDHIGHTAKEVV
jgi:hypothetical protein